MPIINEARLTDADAAVLNYTASNQQWVQNKNKLVRILGNLIGIPLTLIFIFIIFGSIVFGFKDTSAGDAVGILLMCFVSCFLTGAYCFVQANQKFIIDFDDHSIYYSLFNKRYKIIKGSQLMNMYIVDLTQQGRYKGYQYYINYSKDKTSSVKNESDISMQDMIVNPSNAPMVKYKRIRIAGGYKLKIEINQVNYIINEMIIQLKSQKTYN
jgi:hypothetical protein